MNDRQPDNPRRTARPGQPNWADKKVFTTGEAARICGVSQQTIIRCFDRGRLQGFRVPGSKFRRIPREELIRFMRASDIPTDALESRARKLLIVDDDPAVVELFEDVFANDARYVLESASTGYEAGMLTERIRPDLIILDYMLPDINGNIVCRRIRENPKLSRTRILIVSGVVNRSEVSELIGAGADEFLKKPFAIEQLHALVEKLLGEDSRAQ